MQLSPHAVQSNGVPIGVSHPTVAPVQSAHPGSHGPVQPVAVHPRCTAAHESAHEVHAAVVPSIVSHPGSPLQSAQSGSHAVQPAAVHDAWSPRQSSPHEVQLVSVPSIDSHPGVALQSAQPGSHVPTQPPAAHPRWSIAQLSVHEVHAS
jgi:hypothetical protein